MAVLVKIFVTGHQCGDIVVPQQGGEVFIRLLIGDQNVDVGHIAQFDHGVAAKLGVVAGQQHLAGILDQSLGYPHFLIIEIQQRAVVVTVFYP
mgnify:CR=1 FL=1